MGGVCRVGTTFTLADLQIIFVDDVIETVVAYAVVLAEFAGLHLPQLATTDASVL